MRILGLIKPVPNRFSSKKSPDQSATFPIPRLVLSNQTHCLEKVAFGSHANCKVQFSKCAAAKAYSNFISISFTFGPIETWLGTDSDNFVQEQGGNWPLILNMFGIPWEIRRGKRWLSWKRSSKRPLRPKQPYSLLSPPSINICARTWIILK
jgi:hypothetical protein